MKSAEQRWAAEHTTLLDDHYNSVRGYIRREVTRQNLGEQLREFLQFPRHVVDVGGGSGSDARWLARQHHEVVLVEPDEEALEKAYAHRHPALEAIIPGTTEDVLARYGSGSFDLVLSHLVIPYAKSPDEELNELTKLISKGGYLSLLLPSTFGRLKRFEEQGKVTSLQKLIATGKYVNNLGLELYAYLPQDVLDMIQEAGLETINWFGVRVVNDDDDRELSKVPVFHLNRALSAEMKASRDPIQKTQRQMLHFIARKNT
jgi:2-polyprenyl-3-methyl-5-hydroxy-6-metoxy-1,4-benzoquinol methylase